MKKAVTLKLSVAVILGILVCLPAISNATPPGGKFHRRCVTRGDIIKLYVDLNITPEQQQALKNLGEATKSAVEPLIQQAKDLRNQMAETFLSDQIDTGAAETEIDQSIQLRGQIQDIMLHARLQAAQLLTPEQRARLLEEINRIKQCIEAKQNPAADGQEKSGDIVLDLLF